MDKPKSWLNELTGYKGTITLINGETSGLVTVQVYKPGFFSKWLFGKQPKLIIQPVYQDGKAQGSIELAATIAAAFTSPVSSIKGTYDYEQTDLIKAYDDKLDTRLIQGTKKSSDFSASSSFFNNREEAKASDSISPAPDNTNSKKF